MRINFEKGIHVFGKKKADAKPRGILNGELPQTLKEFAASRRSNPEKEKKHYRWHIEARERGELKRLVKIAEGIGFPSVAL